MSIVAAFTIAIGLFLFALMAAAAGIASGDLDDEEDIRP